MAKNKKPAHVSRPVYPGGMAALKKFVGSQLRYPAAAKAAKVEGTVVVRYTLDYTGKVTQAVVKKGIGHGCDEEAVRVVKLLRFNVPQQRKKKVRIHQDLNVHFRLPKKPAKKKPAPTADAPTPSPPATPQPTRIVYSSGQVRGQLKKAPTPAGYTYTITVRKDK